MPRSARHLIKKLLRPNPKERLGAPERGGLQALKAHAFFRDIDWSAVRKRKLRPPRTILVTHASDMRNRVQADREPSFAKQAFQRRIHFVQQQLWGAFNSVCARACANGSLVLHLGNWDDEFVA
ncbi:MAG: hypothetical protein MHM6MM_004703 [Cercozoa sp. M6MM]